MSSNKIDLTKEKNIIPDLYKDGIVKVSNLFDQSFLNEIKVAKDRIFSEYPYGQNDNYEKSLDEVAHGGNYPIRNLLELDPIFKRLLEDKNINSMAEEILGKNFYFTSISMRIIPKTNHILGAHRDYCGGLSFSLLLDDISLNEGETFFYKDSYKNPPPMFVNLNNFSSKIVSTTGGVGDAYFWFPDSWHGRNYNLSNKKTCILILNIENKSNDRKRINIYTDEKNIKLTLLNKIFKLIGNDPNNLLKHFLYCMLRFKLFKKKVEDEKIIYSRLILKNNFSENFSYLNYFKIINFKKFLKALVAKTIQLSVGKNLFVRIKKIIK